MPRKRELTWFQPRRCWKKKRHGKVYYFGVGRCRGRSDRDGYRVALAEWYTLRDRLDNPSVAPGPPPPVPTPAPPAPPVLPATLPTPPTPPNSEQSIWNGVEAIKEAAQRFKSSKDRRKYIKRALQYLVPDEEQGAPVPVSSALPQNLQELIEHYLAGRRREAETDQLSVESYREARIKLQDFSAFAAGMGIRTVQDVTSQALGRYRGEQLRRTALDKDVGGISPTTAHKRLATVHRFLTWCYDQDVLDRLPKNLRRGFATVKMDAPKPQFLTPEEIRRVYEISTPRIRLYIALGLNCAYSQIDIATLEHGHIDWETGIIDRLRHKTKIRQRHKLWPVTLGLLQAEQTEGDGVVLVGYRGNPLITERINPDGKPVRTDSIGQAWTKRRKKVGIKGEGLSFTVLRNSSADEVRKRYEETSHVTDLFLAHTEGAMRKHYTQQHYRLLDEAVEYLDSLYRLGEG